MLSLHTVHVHMGHMLPRVTHFLGLKMNFEKIKLLNHTLAVCCHLFLVSGWFWSHSKGFSISFLLPLLKRGKVGQSPHTYDSTRSLLPLENHKALKFCFGRTKLEYYMYFIILLQLKWNRSFSHGAWARKTSTFHHFECVPPSTVTPFSQKNNSTSSRGGQIYTVFVHMHLKSTPTRTAPKPPRNWEEKTTNN